MDSPHFLRVVQALSFVSGFGPVAVVAGASLLGCGSSSSEPVTGVLVCADANECSGGISASPDAASDATVVVVTGTLPGCEMDEAGSCVDASIGSGGISVPPDSGDDAHHLPPVGGPLSPPELPA